MRWFSAAFVHPSGAKDFPLLPFRDAAAGRLLYAQQRCKHVYRTCGNERSYPPQRHSWTHGRFLSAFTRTVFFSIFWRSLSPDTCCMIGMLNVLEYSMSSDDGPKEHCWNSFSCPMGVSSFRLCSLFDGVLFSIVFYFRLYSYFVMRMDGLPPWRSPHLSHPRSLPLLSAN